MPRVGPEGLGWPGTLPCVIPENLESQRHSGDSFLHVMSDYTI
jgi:hypothetical protein